MFRANPFILEGWRIEASKPCMYKCFQKKRSSCYSSISILTSKDMTTLIFIIYISHFFLYLKNLNSMICKKNKWLITYFFCLCFFLFFVIYHYFFCDNLLGLVLEEILNISYALKFMKDDMMQLIKVVITIWKIIQQSNNKKSIKFSMFYKVKVFFMHRCVHVLAEDFLQH